MYIILFFFADSGSGDDDDSDNDNGDGDDFAKTQAFRSKLQYTRRAYTTHTQLHSRVADVASAATASCDVLLFFLFSVDVYGVVCAAEKWANERDENEKDGVCVWAKETSNAIYRLFFLFGREAQRYIYFIQTTWATNRMKYTVFGNIPLWMHTANKISYIFISIEKWTEKKYRLILLLDGVR